MPRKRPTKAAPRDGAAKKKTTKKTTTAKQKAAKKKAAVTSGRKAPAKKPPAKNAPSKKAPSKKAAAGAAPRRAGQIGAGRPKLVADLGRAFKLLEETRPFMRLRVPYARPDDLLVCEFTFENLRLVGGKLVRDNPSKSATLIVELPPQSFGEEAFLDATGPEVTSTPAPSDPAAFPESGADAGAPPKNTARTNAEPVGPNLPFARLRMAGPSRLAFAMPSRETDLAFTAEALLDACRRWPMRLDVNAAPEPKSSFLLDDITFGRGALNREWVREVSVRGQWGDAARELMSLLGDAGELERPFASAARRLVAQAGDALAGRAPRGLREELTRALGAELDALSRRFKPLLDERRREAAGAALSLLVGQAVAEGRGGDFTLSTLDVLPFFHVALYPHHPSPNSTALELPYRLITSPVPPSNWWHATAPVVRHGRTELWHTRLTKSDDGVGRDPATHVRALWTPDRDLTSDETLQFVAEPPSPFRMSLDTLDRQMLVELMANFYTVDDNEPPQRYVPRAARAQRLALSALGALLDVEGNWNQLPTGVGLEQWRHLANLGRDHYVRVVYRGYLFPFGHAASLIKVTERKFEYLDPGARKNRAAVLRQRFFIVVREPVKTYDGTGHAFGGRNFPFTSVELLTRVTPNLRPPGVSPCRLSDPTGRIYGTVPPRACFWPMLTNVRNFAFQIAATDLCGARVTFPLPLLFVGVEANTLDQQGVGPPPVPVIREIIERYNKEPVPGPTTPPRRLAPMGGAPICFAPPEPGALGDTRQPTTEMVFAAARADVAKLKPRFYPETERGQCGVLAVQRLLQQPDATISVAYPEVYKLHGFLAPNHGKLFLKTLQPYGLTFGDQTKSDALGGLATPSMAIQGLSLTMGPVSAPPQADPANVETALKDVIDNKFEPAKFFDGAKILGGVGLGSLITPITGLALPDVPKLLSRRTDTAVEARFQWETEIVKTDKDGLFVPNADGLPTDFRMEGVVSAPIGAPGQTTFRATATLTNFKVNLFGFIIIWFDELRFTSETGSKPDVAVKLHPTDEAVAFGGPLEFVNTLKDIIPSNGFSDPPSLSVTPSGIRASYSLGVPSVTVGIFALEHVSLGAGFSLPFDARPVEVRFNFSERQRPFSLTVSMLGGGGFFAIGIGTEGVREIEAAIEFGAALSIDLGVASGSVEIKAGVYFHWLQTSVELTGYIRLHGELSVLGLISASLTFNLSLTYLKDNETKRSVVWGEASIEVEIEILFFSFSVSVRCRREFGGSESDPKFEELLPREENWLEYCNAFAAEAA